MRLTNKLAIVTGAASGFGAGIARYVDELNEHSPFRAPSTPQPS